MELESVGDGCHTGLRAGDPTAAAGMNGEKGHDA